MGFLMVAACGIAGLYLGSVFGDAATAWLGAFGGLAIGLVLLRVRGLSTRIEGLRGELDALRHARPASAAPLPAAVATAADAWPAATVRTAAASFRATNQARSSG